jgi:hypothetical protein
MAEAQDHEMTMDDEYDESADGDFEANESGTEDFSSASEAEENPAEPSSERSRKRRKIERAQEKLVIELDSGDEATLREQKPTRRKETSRADTAPADDGNESEGWRARTRAMRTKEKDERRRNKLASSKGSTIDVDKIWEEMNASELHTPTLNENESGDQSQQRPESDDTKGPSASVRDNEKENIPFNDGDETIKIKRTYKFAGEVHVEEKTVLKSSAEAQLWLSQQQSLTRTSKSADGEAVNRPLRKISRFDPNFSNLGAFKSSWAAANADEAKFKGPKLNVVEKSKMDWAEHVDSEGLKEELDTHAKAKEGYLTRMDFLREVEERKEAEARDARIRGR